MFSLQIEYEGNLSHRSLGNTPRTILKRVALKLPKSVVPTAVVEGEGKQNGRDGRDGAERGESVFEKAGKTAKIRSGRTPAQIQWILRFKSKKIDILFK